MKIGVDVGYANTKFVTKNMKGIFLSTVEEGINEINESSTKVTYKNVNYTIGEKTGKVSVDINKINDITFEICLYTAIATAMKEKNKADIDLVTGLPIQYYKSQKDKLKDKLNGKVVDIVLNGEPKRFQIKNVIIFPQSAGLFTISPQLFRGDNIVVDIGGFTIDVSLFNGFKLIKSATYELGMLKLYDKLVQDIKARYGVSYDLLKAEEIIRHKTIIVDGQRVDIEDLVGMTLKNHAEIIMMNIKNAFKEYNTSNRIFIGGGSLVLKDYIPAAINEEDIFANAKAFYKIGEDKFEG